MRYTVRYTNSAGNLESQAVDEAHAVALISKLTRLGAHSVSVQSPDGHVLSGGLPMTRLRSKMPFRIDPRDRSASVRVISRSASGGCDGR